VYTLTVGYKEIMAKKSLTASKKTTKAKFAQLVKMHTKPKGHKSMFKVQPVAPDSIPILFPYIK